MKVLVSEVLVHGGFLTALLRDDAAAPGSGSGHDAEL